MRNWVPIVIGCAVAGMTATAATAAGVAAAPLAASAELKNLDGKTVGTAALSEAAEGVLITLAITDLPPGTHALHLHQTGACEPPFASAGGHFNPGGKQHGFANPHGMHGGDLPNITVPDSRALTVDVFATGVTLGAGANGLLDADGSALVVHAGPDDYRSDPAGAAGDRIACGVIRK